MSIRGLADRHRVHRRTVRQALACAVPPERKVPVRAAPRLDPAQGVDRRDAARGSGRAAQAAAYRPAGAGPAGRRARRWRSRTRRCGTTCGCARPQIWAEAGRALEEVFVPQTHEPGAEAEVDFADLWIDPGRGAGPRCTCSRFGCRTRARRCTGRIPTQGQEAFLEGHVAAFEVLGGVPVVHIRYDNLKSAVSRVLFGRSRIENARWVTFRSHYGFDAFYCQPGREGAHEKGGVEGEGGRFRRTHLVPMPQVESLAELNAAAGRLRRRRRRPPDRAPHADRGSRLRPRGAAAAAAAGRAVRDRADADAAGGPARPGHGAAVSLLGAGPADRAPGAGAAARGRGARLRRPPPGRGPRPRHGARLRRPWSWTTTWRCWPASPARCPVRPRWRRPAAAGCSPPPTRRCGPRPAPPHGDAGGTRALIEVLLLHRHLPAHAVLAGIRAALPIGSTSPDVVAVEARRAATNPATGAVQLRPAGGGRCRCRTGRCRRR